MVLKFILLGFLVKIITGFDDMLARIPLIAVLTKKREGKVAFILGSILAVLFAIAMSISFAAFLKEFKFYKYYVVLPIFVLAVYVYFRKAPKRPDKKAEKAFIKEITTAKFLQMVTIGFVASVVTLLDDFIAYAPLLAGNLLEKFNAILGIVTGTILEIGLIFYFSKNVEEFKYKKEIATLGLVILGALVLAGAV